MSDFLTITERYIKENSIINGNVDMAIIKPKIILVQDMYLHTILGTPLFDEIKAQIIAGTVTTLNQTLLDEYVLKTMLYFVEMEVTPYMKYRYTNKGIQVKNSDNSASADLSEIQFLMDKARNTAQMYAERTTRYLRANIALFPLFLAYTNMNDIRPNKTNYTCSLFLDNGLSDEDERNIIIGNY